MHRPLSIEVTAGDGVTNVALAGSIDERANLADCADRVPGASRVDLHAVEFINSLGVTEWIRFLRALSAKGTVTLVRCSETMVRVFNMVTGAGDRSNVETFTAPYACDDCGREDPFVLPVTDELVDGDEDELPELKCAECGGVMRFSDVPERYLAFLRFF